MCLSVWWLQVDAAVVAAKEAFPDWSARSPQQRAEVLNKLADLIEANLEEFVQAESRDQGDFHCLIGYQYISQIIWQADDCTE